MTEDEEAVGDYFIQTKYSFGNSATCRDGSDQVHPGKNQSQRNVPTARQLRFLFLTRSNYITYPDLRYLRAVLRSASSYASTFEELLLVLYNEGRTSLTSSSPIPSIWSTSLSEKLINPTFSNFNKSQKSFRF